MKLYAVSLYGGDDTRDALRFYQDQFDGSIEKSSLGHSVWKSVEGILVVFSKITISCPVYPGTLVWQAKEPKDPSKWRPEVTEPNYRSYLDPWGNRNWFYFPLESK